MIRLPWSSPDRPLEEWAVTITSEDLGHSHPVRQLFELPGGKHEGYLMALLHESSLARTMPTNRILTGRCDTTLVGRGRPSD